MKPSHPNAAKSQRPPTKWVVGLLLLLALYAILQPLANSQFGWQLPSLTSLAQQADGGSGQAGNSRSWTEGGSPHASQPDSSIRTDNSWDGDDSNTLDDRPASANTIGRGDVDRQSEPNLPDRGPAKTDGSSTNPTIRGPPSESLSYAYLKPIGPEDFLSPAGLRYTRGSEEGHRLRHIAKHLVDQPDRPGSHGVFQADMPQVLRWIDEVYQRAQQEEAGTSKRREQDRWVLEASFNEPVGYVGGSTGERRGHPPTRHIRLVVEDNRVITAFPF